MKARVVAVEPTVFLEMTLREAQILKALVTGVEVHSTGVVSMCMRDLLKMFGDAGVQPDATFSDLFTGKVVTKPIPVGGVK